MTQDQRARSILMGEDEWLDVVKKQGVGETV